MARSSRRRLSGTRPRDRLGRPLPWGVPGFPGVPERADITTSEAIDEAHDYLAEGLPFHAHEVLEQRWRCSPTAEREWWRGLAQAAAALTHRARGNTVGAARLADRARLTRGDRVPRTVASATDSARIAALLGALDLAD